MMPWLSQSTQPIESLVSRSAEVKESQVLGFVCVCVCICVGVRTVSVYVGVCLLCDSRGMGCVPECLCLFVSVGMGGG